MIPQSHYAFSAYGISAITTSVGSTLVFTQILVNDKGVYNTTTGTFIAPCDGVYEFQSTLTVGVVDKSAYIEFMAGEAMIGTFTAYDCNNRVSSSGSAIGTLLKGTQVYLRVSIMTSGFKFRADSDFMNTFTGHLIGK